MSKLSFSFFKGRYCENKNIVRFLGRSLYMYFLNLELFRCGGYISTNRPLRSFPISFSFHREPPYSLITASADAHIPLQPSKATVVDRFNLEPRRDPTLLFYAWMNERKGRGEKQSERQNEREREWKRGKKNVG